MNTSDFIVFEGGEAVGKSLHSRKLYQYFIDQGKDAILTREPGGSVIAERIRALIFSEKEPETDKLSPETETLLMFAARRDHLEKTVLPALNAGKIVICDRFIDSTYVYQVTLGGLKKEIVDQLAEMFVPVKPDIVFFLDASVETVVERLKSRNATNRNRYDNQSYEAFTKLREAWKRRAEESGAELIFSEGLEEEIFNKILKKYLNLKNI